MTPHLEDGAPRWCASLDHDDRALGASAEGARIFADTFFCDDARLRSMSSAQLRVLDATG